MQHIKQFCMVAIIATGMAACSTKDVTKEAMDAIFPNATVEPRSTQTRMLSDLFSDYRLIELETSEKSLIGGRNLKVLKRDSVFYVKSFHELLLFDSTGHFLRKLSKIGGAPDEYPEFLDFDISMKPQGNEILIGTHGGIMRYDAMTMGFIDRIPYDGFVNQLKYVNDSTIVIATPDAMTLKVIDTLGRVHQEFLPLDVANSGTKPIGFREHNGLVLYQLVNSNDVAVFNPVECAFCIRPLIPPTDKLQTSEINRLYYEKYGFMNQMSEIDKNYISIGAFQSLGSQGLITTIHPGRIFAITMYDTDKISTHEYHPESGIGFDIVNDPDSRFPATIIACDSDDSFLFLIPSQREENGGEEDNPWLLEVKRLTL